MPLDTFRQVFLPYCIRQNVDGTFSILNREYEDLGSIKRGPIGSNGVRYSMKGLGVKSLDRLAHNIPEPRHGGERFWLLYDDGCLPDSSKANWKSYTDRLWQLRKFELKRR
jgi:hypothetical protein